MVFCEDAVSFYIDGTAIRIFNFGRNIVFIVAFVGANNAEAISAFGIASTLDTAPSAVVVVVEDVCALAIACLHVVVADEIACVFVIAAAYAFDFFCIGILAFDVAAAACIDRGQVSFAARIGIVIAACMGFVACNFTCAVVTGARFNTRQSLAVDASRVFTTFLSGTTSTVFAVCLRISADGLAL